MKLEPIDFDDYPQLLRHFRNQTYRLCVYSLPSLIAWHTREYRPLAAVAGDLLITGYEYEVQKEHRHLLLPISPVSRNGNSPPERLEEIARSLGFQAYCFVPEDYIESYGRQRVASAFVIERQKEFDDYVYLTEDLALLKGNRYSKKRNLIRQFDKSYLSENRVELEEMTSANAADCIDFLEAWCEERNCDYDEDMDLACERRAAVNMINHIDQVDARGLVARVDGVVSAFGIGCGLTREMGVFHFEKAFSRIKGLYQYFDQQCARRLFRGYRYINKESDMDIPGLTQAKRSYHPALMVRSYRLTLR